MNPRFSLVVPVYNEAGNVIPLITAAAAVHDGLAGACEIVIVNDGSTDNTAADIATAIKRWPNVRALQHPQNLGQAAALLNGLRDAHGEIILTMDGDGQNDPRDFPLLIAPVESGTLDLACGWRVERHDRAVHDTHRASRGTRADAQVPRWDVSVLRHRCDRTEPRALRPNRLARH